jgi:hypothetical protein
MSSENNQLWVSIGVNELKEFGQVMRKITETNVFPFALSEDGFTKVNEFLYEKSNDQLIRIFQQDGKWLYQNLKNTIDTGSLIQFIANRLHNEQPVIAKEPAQLFIASKIAKLYHRDYIKSLRADYMTKLLQGGPTNLTTRQRRL